MKVFVEQSWLHRVCYIMALGPMKETQGGPGTHANPHPWGGHGSPLYNEKLNLGSVLVVDLLGLVNPILGNCLNLKLLKVFKFFIYLGSYQLFV